MDQEDTRRSSLVNEKEERSYCSELHDIYEECDTSKPEGPALTIIVEMSTELVLNRLGTMLSPERAKEENQVSSNLTMDFDDIDETEVLEQYKKFKKRNKQTNGVHPHEKELVMEFESGRKQKPEY